MADCGEISHFFADTQKIIRFLNMNISSVKLRAKLILKAIFYKIFDNSHLKTKILRFFSRDYELSQNELDLHFMIPLKCDSPKGDFIATLTTFPARIGILKYALHSIFAQTLRAKKVILVLSKAEFDEANAKILQDVLYFQKFGLEIMWVTQNLRVYNKIIHTLRAFSNDILITIDDDIYYPSNLFSSLYHAYLSDKSAIWAHKARIVPFSDKKIQDFFEWKIIRKNNKKWQNTPRFNIYLEGCGGVLYPPHCLYKDALDSEKFMRLAPNSDDLWLWAMAIINGTKIACVPNPLMGNGAAFTNPASNPALWHSNMRGGNDRQLKALLEVYPQILQILNKEANL